MAHNGGTYYPDRTSCPGWQQAGYSGPLQNQRLQFTPQNQNPPYRNQNLGPPSFVPQNQGPAHPLQNPGTSYPPRNQSSLFPPRNRGPTFSPQNRGPFCPPKNQGPSFPPQNQGPPFPAQNQDPRLSQNQGNFFSQNQGPQNHPQNLGPHLSPQNQGTPFPAQNQGPLGPPQNQGPQFAPQNQGALVYQQNQIALSPPQNQAHVFPPQNQGLRCPPQNQGPLYPQNQGLPDPQNKGLPGPSIPSQNQGPPFPYQNQGLLCPPQNQRPVFHPQNQGPRFPLQNPENNGSPYAPRNQVPPYPHSQGKDHYSDQQNDNLKSLNAYPEDEECYDSQYDNYGDEWSNQNDDYEDDQSSQTRSCNKNNAFKQRTPSTCDRRKGYFKKDFIEKEFKKPPFIKRLSVGPTELPNQSSTKKQSCNNIHVNIFKSSDLDCRKPHQDLKLQTKDLDSSMNEIKQSCPLFKQTPLVSSKQRKRQEYVCTKSIQGKFNLKSNEHSTRNRNEQSRKTNPAQDKRNSKHNNTNTESSATSNVHNEYSQSKLIHVIQNTSTESAKLVQKHDKVHPKLDGICSVKANNSNNKQSTKTNKAEAKEALLKYTKGSSYSTLNQRKSSHLNSFLKSQKTSNVQPEKLRSGKRLHPQDTSINTKKIKICDKTFIKEKPHSPTKVLSIESNLISKPEMQIKIKDISSSHDRVKINETTVDQTSLSQPKDKFKPNTKITIENDYGAKLNQTENLPRLKETTLIPNKITNDTKVNETTNMSQLTNESVVKNWEERPNQTLNIKTKLDDAIMKPSDVRTRNRTNDVPSKGALKNELVKQNNTNSSQTNSISPDSTGNIYSEQFESNCNESTSDDKSQNSDLQVNYQSLNEDSQNTSDFSGDGVNPKLREFDILDEVEESEGDEGDQSIISSESGSEASDQDKFGVDIEDIDAMLEEGLPTSQKGTDDKAPKKLRHKVILEEIGHNHFDLLPEGWIKIIHNSGMPVYLQQKSRVCAMSRPYFLGPGSVRSHKIPLSAIPCLQYKRALEMEKKYEEENRGKQTTNWDKTNENQLPLMPAISAKIETAEENEAAQSLDPTELREYCKQVFNFKTISIMPFKSWGDQRKFARMTKDLKKQQRPLLPSGTKLLKFPIHNPDGTISKSKGEWVINPNGKSYVCILHEYVQHALKQHPKYQFNELQNPATPYSATVYIGEMQYGTGTGGSKKYAKLEAAKAALEVLIPEMKDKIERDSEFGMHSGIAKRSQNFENSIFDQIHIEDPRVAEFCAKTTEPPPYAILATCLQRNGMSLDEVKVEYNMNTKKHKEDEFKMTVGNHTVAVLCKNKRDGKQKAAQAILKALHPNIEHFGSLLRMYGNLSVKSVKQKKQEEQEITGLQCKAAVNQPNYAILNKLYVEMRKMAVKRKEQQAKGKFLCHNDLLLPTASTTDLNKINL